MLFTKYLWLLPITCLSFPVSTHAVALNSQTEPATALTISKAADIDQKVIPKEGHQIIAIILQDKKTKPTPQTGMNSNKQTAPNANTAKPKVEPPGPPRHSAWPRHHSAWVEHHEQITAIHLAIFGRLERDDS